MATQSSTTLRWFSALTGLTSLSIFVQAVTAGEFVSQKNRGGWIDGHDIVADVVAVLALALMIFTIVTLRKVNRSLLGGTIALFVLVVVQIVIGHQITDNKQDWLIGIHVPLAFIIFGIAVWLPITAAMMRRAGASAA
jgi:heme A synthase